MKKLILILLCLVLGLGSNAQSNEAKIAFNKGTSHYNAKNYLFCIAYFEEALSLEPKFSEAHLCLGHAYHELGKLDESAVHYEAAIGQQKQDEKTWYNLAMVYKELQKMDKALNAVNEALRINSKYDKALRLKSILTGEVSGEVMDSHTALALGLYKKGDYSGAIKLLESKKSKELGPQDYYIMAITYDKMANYRKAKDSYESVLKLDSLHFDANLQLGILLFNEQAYKEALVVFNRATRLQPKDPYATYFTGVAYFETKQYDQAIPYLREAVLYYPDAGEARSYFDKALSASSLKSNSLGVKDKPQKKNEKQSNKYVELFNAGVKAYNKSDYTEAATAFGKIKDDPAADATLFYYLGISLKGERKPLQAQQALEKAIEMDPSLHKAYTALGHIAYQSEDYIMAGAYYQRAIELGNDDPELYLNLGSAYYNLNNLPKAALNFESALRGMPRDTRVLFNLGMISFKMEKWAQAKDYYNQVLAIDDTHFDAKYQMSLTQIQLGEIDEAISIGEWLVEMAPESSEGYMVQAICYDRKGNRKLSEKFKKQAYKIDPRLKK